VAVFGVDPPRSTKSRKKGRGQSGPEKEGSFEQEAQIHQKRIPRAEELVKYVSGKKLQEPWKSSKVEGIRGLKKRRERLTIIKKSGCKVEEMRERKA